MTWTSRPPKWIDRKELPERPYSRNNPDEIQKYKQIHSIACYC